MLRAIRTVEEFYAHAIAIERHAAERYRRFARHFGETGEEVLSGLCDNLASLEEEHLAELRRASAPLELPTVPEASGWWFTQEAAATRDALQGLRNPRELLEVALHDERRAAEFFRWVAATATDGDVRVIARLMVTEEERHFGWVRHALEYQPFQPLAS